MYNMGLTVTQRRAYEALLCSHHTLDVVVTVMDMNHNELTDVSARLLDGQVTVDAGAQVTRGLQLELLDPTRALHLDSNSPNDGAMFADRMIRVRYAITNPTGATRYSVPVFTGPIVSMERSGVAIGLQCLGKESMGLAAAWNTRTFKKGTQIDDTIRAILRDVIGENKYVIPDITARLPRNVSVGGDRLPWVVAKQLARSVGYQLFYDGKGVARMRKFPTASVFSFREGSGGSVKTEPEAGFDIDTVINAVEVFGKKPEQTSGSTAKKQPHARVVADRSHPLSPWSLGGNGAAGNRKPRFIPIIIEDDSITKDSEALERAKARLKQGLLESVEVRFDSLVIPHLEERDVVRVVTDQVTTNFAIKQFAVPLTAAGQMSVGYVRNVKPNKSVIRARKRGK
jgi:hypothetical protein